MVFEAHGVSIGTVRAGGSVAVVAALMRPSLLLTLPLPPVTFGVSFLKFVATKFAELPLMQNHLPIMLSF